MKILKNSADGLKVFALATTLVLGTATFASADALYRQLQVGMSGSDVGTLQTFLAKDVTIYPQGKVTNYFGFLTKSAVSNFQAKNGISAIGRVGPQTLSVINSQMANGTVVVNGNGIAPLISGISTNVSYNGANISYNTNEFAKGVIYYSMSPMSTYEGENSVSINGAMTQTDSVARSSQSISLTNLQSNTTYYYMIYVTDVDGNVSVTLQNTFRTN